MRGLLQSDAAAEALLGWWALAGVDSAVAEEPVNWLRPVVRTRHVEAVAVSVGPVAAAMPATLSAFHDWLRESGDVPEAAWPGTRIIPTGQAGAALMVICDMPDADDMRNGALLSGDAGRLFDAMLAAIGLSRDRIYLTSLAVARPVGGLFSPADSAMLAKRMHHHVALAAPKRLLLLGDKTSRALLSANDEATPKRAGNGLRDFNHDRGILQCIATSHPRLLLKQSAGKAESWRVLQNLIEGNDT